MRQRARIDTNHREVVKALRQIGCSVLSLAAVGKGCPDLLVGRQRKNWIMEVKNGALSPSLRRLTTDEQKFRDLWAGQYTVVESAKQAVYYILRECGE